jgi:hypothetical protein
MMADVPRASRLLALLGIATLLAVSCDGNEPPPGPTSSAPTGLQFAVQMATVDLYAGAPQRAQIGILGSDAEKGVRPLSFGTVDVAFSYLGADGSSAPEPGPTATARYVAAYGFPEDGAEPELTPAAESRGVYQADVTFDQAGLWQADVSFDVDGFGTQTLVTTFPVVDDPIYPAPGDRAPRTENLSLADEGEVPASAIDSLASDDTPIPDPELHQTTVADAIAEGHPILLIVGTPAYCTSQICGPENEAVGDLSERYPDRAEYIHIELWRDFNANVISEGAAEWVFRNEDATDPWLFLIGADGKVNDRWMPLFDPDEVAAALEALPPMDA